MGLKTRVFFVLLQSKFRLSTCLEALHFLLSSTVHLKCTNFLGKLDNLCLRICKEVCHMQKVGFAIYDSFNLKPSNL